MRNPPPPKKLGDSNRSPLVLALETSCDDTSVALVTSHPFEDSTHSPLDHSAHHNFTGLANHLPHRPLHPTTAETDRSNQRRGYVLHMKSASQDLHHAQYGGIVPEVASRSHWEHLLPLVDQVLTEAGVHWDQIDGLAVTSRPGLMGSLIVGVITAKALALAQNKPLIGVNHLEGHLLAPFLSDPTYTPPENFTLKENWEKDWEKEPFLALIVSGGHTHFYLAHQFGQYEEIGSTRDDAAGEALDKFAKMVGLGFPGGARVDQKAQEGNPRAYDFPRPLIRENHLMMSFSGLKTAALRQIQQRKERQHQDQISSEIHLDPVELNDLCASFQEAIVDVLLTKIQKAVELHRVRKIIISGGVSANSRLRALALKWAQEAGISLLIPPLRYCTDNAAMIGLAGQLLLEKNSQKGLYKEPLAVKDSALNLSPSAVSLPEDFMRC